MYHFGKWRACFTLTILKFWKYVAVETRITLMSHFNENLGCVELKFKCRYTLKKKSSANLKIRKFRKSALRTGTVPFWNSVAFPLCFNAQNCRNASLKKLEGRPRRRQDELRSKLCLDNLLLLCLNKLAKSTLILNTSELLKFYTLHLSFGSSGQVHNF